MTRTFRFGLAIDSGFEADPIAQAAEAEAAGFDVVVMGDHIGPEFAPLPTLAAIAASTTSIRLATYVLNADVRNPVQLGWEAATIDRISNGRFELGLGAGHTPQEYSAMGVHQAPPTARKRRLMESVEIIVKLLAGESVTTRGEFFDLVDAHVNNAGSHIPILVGGNGAALLEHAGKHADAIGLQGLGRTLDDGHRHTVRWEAVHLERQLEQIRRGAGNRYDDIELSALVQVVEVTDNADAAIAALCERAPSVSPTDAVDAPYALIGTVDEIADKLVRCRDTWGITYFVVRDLTAFAPVIARLRAKPG